VNFIFRSAVSLLILGLGACSHAPTSAPRHDPQPLVQSPPGQVDGEIISAAERHLPSLVELYRHFHANPELSYQEVKTAARFAEEVRKAGWEVTEAIGRTGVAAILKNGTGPTLLVRIDMDALPVKEETGLPYAATG